MNGLAAPTIEDLQHIVKNRTSREITEVKNRDLLGLAKNGKYIKILNGIERYDNDRYIYFKIEGDNKYYKVEKDIDVRLCLLDLETLFKLKL